MFASTFRSIKWKINLYMGNHKMLKTDLCFFFVE